MAVPFVLVVGVPLLVFASALGATLVGMRRVPALRRLPVDARADWPRVSIVVPACDEEAGVLGALRSLLAQQYPSVQVVAVDDRSSDGTGAIMDRLAIEDPRLSVVHIATLPDGWLGKLNALQRGVEKSDGEWLLFADADAHLGPHTLKNASATVTHAASTSSR
jgi:cellulose synthase/poly-beta-1,6-N-acetylglucosamine synthase-like glycosyltransferase